MQSCRGPLWWAKAAGRRSWALHPLWCTRNDGESTLSAITQNDVVYYLEKTKTVWAYHNQVTGLYESAEPNRSNPTSVVVSGVSYSFESSAAAYAMSTTGTFKIGDTVTLLLGRNNTVAAVIDPTSAGTNTYGIVLATGIDSYTDAQGKPYTAPYVKILGVDGVTYQYQTDKSGYYKEGDLVKVAFESGVAKLSRLNQFFQKPLWNGQQRGHPAGQHAAGLRCADHGLCGWTFGEYRGQSFGRCKD